MPLISKNSLKLPQTLISMTSNDVILEIVSF